MSEEQNHMTYFDIAVANTQVKSTESEDMVNHPPHYNSHPKGIECIEVIEDGPHHNINTAIKYLWRVNWGGKWDDLEDLAKAKWSIEREIARRS